MLNDQSMDLFRLEGTSIDQRLGGVRAFSLAVCAYACLFTILYGPTMFSGHLLCPEVQALDVLSAKRTFWSDGLFSGHPVVVDPGSEYFYPFSWLFYFIPASWNAFIIFANTLSGAFCFSYVRLLTNSNFAAIVGSFAFAFGFLSTELALYHLLHTTCWMVATLLALELLARKRSGLVFGLGSIAIAFTALSGHTQILTYALGMWTLYILGRATFLEKNDRRGYVLLGLTMIVLGILVSGIQLFQTFALVAGSSRSRFTFDDFLTYSVHPVQLVGVFMPFIFGGAPEGVIHQPAFSPFLAWCQYLYYGWTTLFLALPMVVAFRSNRFVVFWSLISVLTFLLAFGSATPLAWLFYHIPPYGMFRCLYRLLLISSLANAVLTGLCVAMIEKRLLPQKAMVKVMVVLSTLFAFLLFELPSFGEMLQKQALKHGIEHLGLLPWTNPAIGIPCLALLASIASCLFYVRQPGKLSRVALCVVLVCDLGFTSWCALGAIWRLGDMRTEAPSITVLQPPLTAIKYVPLANAAFNRILTVRGGSSTYDELLPNVCRIWRVPQASGYSPLMQVRYGELLNMTEGGFLIPPWHYKSEDRCFDILSIKYAMAENGDNRLEEIIGPHGPNWKKLEELGTASVHENLRVLPRCWLVNQAVKLAPTAVLSAIKTSRFENGAEFDPLRVALVEEMPAGDWSGEKNGSGGPVGKSSVLSCSETSVRVETDCPSESLLVLSDPYFSGWQARIDGVIKPIFRTDYILRGVDIPPGKHIVDFDYFPQNFLFSAIVAGISLILIMATAIVIDRKRL